jgi:hypothetical protein
VTPDPEATVAEARVMTAYAGEIAPGLTVIVGKVVVTAEPAIVAQIVVAVPETTPVKTAV